MTSNELEQCVHLYGKDIYAFCMHVSGSRQEAEDLYQDTFLTALQKRKKLNMTQNPKSYFLSVALHLWKNKKRKYAWRQKIAPEDSYEELKITCGDMGSMEKTTEEALVFEEERRAVLLAVKKLEEKYRIPILLYYMEQLSVKEIALILMLPVGTVKSRLHYAREILKKELEVYFHE